MLRMLITGSRDWDDARRLCWEMQWHALGSTDVTVVHGKCPTGADYLANKFAVARGWIVEPHPAQWMRYGKRAGFLRNAEMVQAGAAVCLAFIRNNSKGASMCADLAEKAGIPTHRFTEETQ